MHIVRVLYIRRTIDNMRMLLTTRAINTDTMPNLNLPFDGDASESAIRNAALSYGLVEDADMQGGQPGGPDFVFKDDRGARYVAEVKVVRDGRSDRVVAQLSVAIIQACHYAKNVPNAEPLAIVFVSNMVPSTIRQVKNFADQYAEHANVAIVTSEGASLVRLQGTWKNNGMLDKALPEANERSFLSRRQTTAVPFNPFSDLNQWMLKVLLAPEISAELLTAPRAPIYSGADLARAARASPMSANRLLQYLKREHYLVNGRTGITLGRREEFFSLWRSASMASPAEYSMRFLARVAMKDQLASLLRTLGDKACLGLFSAADHLGMGHVGGVPPYIYMHKLPQLEAQRPEWEMTDVCKPGQAPDFFIRRAMAPISTFRGAVQREGQLCTDVIQVWLDVINHPTRGAEQAAHIYRTFLQSLVEAH
ncbi:MAG: hypothetical protein EKK45_14210 [Curvibacter sp.]|nr:MAG: hypothetical protein EKK45_14210 [Curvibacter sp.]